MNIERRNFDSGVELRADGDTPQIGGHAAVFNDVVTIFDGFQERFLAGAFKQSIAEDDVRALWNHDSAFVMGRTKSGTLRLKEDDQGLAFENDPPDAQWARDIVTSIKRGDISGASIGFRSMDEEWEKIDGVQLRTITRAQLFDVSPVAFPAYPTTDVGVRSLLESSPNLPDDIRDELARAMMGVGVVEQAGKDLQAAIDRALSTQVESIAVRVAEILADQRADDRAVLDMRRRRLDLEEAM